MWLYYPSEFMDALRMLDKAIIEEFMVFVKNTKVDSNLGELISTKTETYFATLYSEPIGRDDTMRPRMMKFLRSLFSEKPLEDTFRMLITIIVDELLMEGNNAGVTGRFKR